MKKLFAFFLFISQVFWQPCSGQVLFPAIASPVQYDPDYYNVLLNAWARGINVGGIPTATKAAQNQLMIDIKSALVVSSISASGLDQMKVMKGKKIPSAFTDINWVNPATNKTVQTNNPLYINGTGFAGAGLIGGGLEYLNMGKLGPNCTQSSGEIITYYSDMAPGTYSDGGFLSSVNNNVAFNVTRTATTVAMAWGTNATTVFTTGSQSDDLYFWGANGTTKFVRKGSASRLTATVTSTGFWPYDFYLLNVNRGDGSSSGTSGGDKKIGFFASGRLLTTTEEAAINTAWNNYLTALAAIPDYSTIGTMYSGSSWANLNDFTNNGATVSASGGLLQFTGGANNYTQSLDLTSISGTAIGSTALNKWTQTITFDIPTLGASANWGGVGIRSSNSGGAFYDLLITMDFTTTNAGKMKVFSGPSHTQVVPTSSAVSISAGNRVSMTFTLFDGNVSYSAYNVTTSSTPVTGNLTLFGTTNGFITNTGHFAIFYGGNFNVASWTVGSNEYSGPGIIAWIGTSKTQGYRAADGSGSSYTSIRNSYVYRLQDYMGPIVNLGGSGDKSADWITRTYEVINWVNPDVIYIEGACNDIRASVPDATWQANISSLISTFQAAGKKVVFFDGIQETPGVGSGVDQTAVSTWTNGGIGCPVIHSLGVSVTQSDGVHPDKNGMNIFFRWMLSNGMNVKQ